MYSPVYIRKEGGGGVKRVENGGREGRKWGERGRGGGDNINNCH